MDPFRRLLQLLPDRQYIQLMYLYHFHRFANLCNPRTFNEKLQWLKLNDHNPQYITMVDKFAVKDYIAGIIGDEFVIPTLGVWQKPDDIDLDDLPNKFVLKWNHDSGSIVICRDKATFDSQFAINKLRHGEYVNGYWYGREWPYKGVKPCIIAEQLLEIDGETHGDLGNMKNPDLVDYKFMCFNGEVKCCFTCSGRFSSEGLKVTFYDNNWEIMPFTRSHPRENKPCPRPYSFNKMLWAAEQLTKDIPFARIDFYEVDKKPYFGEITLYPGSGLEPFQPSCWDKIMGDWLVLPQKNDDE